VLFITHDVGETRDFDRVLVIESGRLVEAGAPARLALDPCSRYRALLEAEEANRSRVWLAADWRRVNLVEGCLTGPGAEGPA
jgi:ATP-binding cassette subfamily B protein